MLEKNLPDHIQWKEFENNQELILELERNIIRNLKTSLAKRPRASLVVPGGRTPIKLFQKLSMSTINWSKVDLTLTDERWVKVSHKSSNERLVKKHLVKNRASPINFFSLKTKHTQAVDAIFESSKNLSKLNRPVDIVILGLGTDGHTASLFHNDKMLATALSPNNTSLLHSVESSNKFCERITFTYRFLNEASKKYLYIVGNKKLATIKLALNIDNPIKMPICAFLRNPISIYWSPQ